MTAETPREIALEIVAIGDRTWRMDVLARAVLAAPEHVETRDWQEMAEEYAAADDLTKERRAAIRDALVGALARVCAVRA